MSMRAASDVSRRINAERLLLIAWVRAILLQFAHPLIAAGVAQHSTFRGGPMAAWARLRHTLGAMLALTFGTDAERDAAVDGIRAIHRRVNGTLAHACGPFAAGSHYSAEDPALLTWVHATLIESTVLVYEQLIGPLSAAERDRYCDDAAELADVLRTAEADVVTGFAAAAGDETESQATEDRFHGPGLSNRGATLRTCRIRERLRAVVP